MAKSGLLFTLLISLIHPCLSDDFDFDLPIVTSASRLSQSVLNSPSMVTVVDRDMIEASGFIEIPDIFRLVPGFIVAHATGEQMTVNSHGEGWELPSRMQILIDGRSVYTSTLSAIDWNVLGIHIEDIEKIEVVHGPAASAYGSNSYAGAINIITKRPELDDTLTLKYRQGSQQEKYLLLRHSGEIDNLTYALSASKRKNGGYEDYIETRVTPGSPQEPFFDDFRDDRELNTLNFTSSLQLNHSNHIWLNLSKVTGHVESANLAPKLETIDRRAFFAERDREVDAWSANVSWQHQLSETQEVEIEFFHNYYDTDDMTDSALFSELFGFDPLPFFGFQDQSVQLGLRSFHSHRSDIEFTYSQVNENGLKFNIGTGLRYDTQSSDSAYPLDGTQTNMGKRLFTNIEIPLFDGVSMNLGGLYEMNNIERPRFSPRGSLNLRLNQNQSLRFGASRAYRIPGLYEKYVNAGTYLEDGTLLDSIYATTEDFSSEEVTTFDISYLGQSRRLPLSWEVRAYKEEYRDNLVFVEDNGPADDYRYLDNAGWSNHYGFEGHLTYRPSKTSFIRFHFNKGHISGSRLNEVNPIQYTDQSSTGPDKVYGILASKSYQSWQGSLGFYHVGKVEWTGLIGDEVPSYNRLDASIKKTISLSNNQSLIVKVAGQNILDEDYNEFSIDTDLSFEPRYYGSITLIHK